MKSVASVPKVLIITPNTLSIQMIIKKNQQLNTQTDRNRAEVEAILTKAQAEVLAIQAMTSLYSPRYK